MSATSDFTPPFSLAARFALRELRGGLRGFYIFIACIALGVAAISGVSSVSRALTDGILAEGTSILGGDISFSLIHREADDAEFAFIEKLGDVSKVAGLRTMARVPDTLDQNLVELKAVDEAYPLVGAVELSQGMTLADALRPQDGVFGAAADAGLLARLNLSVGDEIAVGRGKFRIAATILREPDRLAGGLELGPRLMISHEGLEQTALVQPGGLVRWRYRVALPAQTSDGQIAAIMDEAGQEFPKAGWRIRARTEAAPGLERNITRFAQFLSLVGLTALVVGGVGVANAVRAFLDTKRAVIATFKCIGARGGFVFQVYLVQILILASIGVGLGLMLGALIPFIAAGVLSSVLPVQAVTAIYPMELGLGLIYGYLTALAFALWPLGRAHDISPRALFRDEASAQSGWPRRRYIAATMTTAAALSVLAVVLAYDQRIAVIYIGASLLTFVLLLGVGRGVMTLARRWRGIRSTELRMAVANIHRPGALTPSVVLSLGLGLTLLVALSLIDANLRRELTSTIAQEAPSFFFLDVRNEEKDAFDGVLRTAAAQADIDGAPMLRGRITSLKGTPSDQIDAPQEGAWVLRGDRGITYSASVPENSTLTDGAWWPEDYAGPPLVSMESKAGAALGLKVGDDVTVNVLGREISAKIANFRQLNWRSLGINFVMVFSPNTFAGAPHAHLRTITFDKPLESLEAEDARELSLLRAVTADFPTVTAIRVKDAIAQVNDLLGQLAWAVRAAASVTLIASVLVLAGSLAASHQNRIYDAVILKTLGATRGRLVTAFAMEYALLGLATCLFAVFAGSLAAYFIVTQIMGGSFVFMPFSAMTAAVVALVLTVGFGLIGTWRILGEKPAPVLRNL